MLKTADKNKLVARVDSVVAYQRLSRRGSGLLWTADQRGRISLPDKVMRGFGDGERISMLMVVLEVEVI